MKTICPFVLWNAVFKTLICSKVSSEMEKKMYFILFTRQLKDLRVASIHQVMAVPKGQEISEELLLSSITGKSLSEPTI